ncbi:NAD-dependent epimerase/dehydratase family protein [bacterium]|nr:NAD-dependent epimerase/dehydratase family protein [bacterium]MBT3795109.1 NAD-dependent epimerase/dehydratase family protein [bacterium]MBT4634205.1 NAD-dependent epimerase/dehydratase family protein [bacterium]
MNILVTGATGYIGPFLVNKLKALGHTVVILVRKKEDFHRLESEGFKCILGDVTKKESLVGIFKNIEILFHLANIASWWLPNNQTYYDVNVKGTVNLFEEAKKFPLKKVIHISSIAAIRQPEGIIANEESIHQGDFESHYSRSKYLVEKETVKYMKDGLPLVTLNPGVVTGPRDTKTFGKTVLGIANGKVKAKFFPGSYIPLVYIDNVIEVMVKAIDLKVGSKYVVVGENIKIGDVFDKVCRIMKKERIIKTTPNLILSLVSYYSEFVSFFTNKRPSLPVDGLKAIKIGAQASSKKSVDELGIKYLDGDQILTKLIDWFNKNNLINN